MQYIGGNDLMAIKQEPFRKYNTEEKQDTFTIRLNDQERADLEKDKKVLKQTKDGTAIKQLAALGRIVLHEGKTGCIIDIVTNNSRKNQRIGINDF